jgi:hypothetical protein
LAGAEGRWVAYASRVQVEQSNAVFRNLGTARFAALTAEAGLTAQPPADIGAQRSET